MPTTTKKFNYLYNHKYFIFAKASINTEYSGEIRAAFKYKSYDGELQYYIVENDTVEIKQIINSTNLGDQYFSFNIDSNESIDFTISNVFIYVIDLTQMLGSDVANSIYTMNSNDQNHVAGINWFEKYFLGYMEYDEGILSGSKINSHISTGFNLWDEEWLRGYLDSSTGNFVSYQTVFSSKNFIPIIDSLEYYVYGNIKIFYFDINKTYLTNEWKGNATFTPPPGAAFIRFQASSGSHGAVYSGTGICINISNSEKNGTYEPYCGHTYPLDPSIVLNGVSTRWNYYS